MVSFIVYDLIFMALFALMAIFLLHKHRKNLKRQGWIFLYHSKFGLKFIDWTAKKFEKILKPLQYLIITSGYILMISILYVMILSVYRYITSPIPKELQSVPPIAPLIPYFPAIFNLESIFPPLYFTYFLVALAIVAVSHEFSHGIIARLNKIKVKTTGLAFFGPFFGAFVEPDEKQMNKSKKFVQLSILAAGTFANVLMTVLFGLLLWGFFAMAFAPVGVNFNAYPQAEISTNFITHVDGVPIDEIANISELGDDLVKITAGNETFFAPGSLLVRAAQMDAEKIIVFEDAPAVRNQLRGPISEINGEKMTSVEELRTTISSFEPGETIEIVSLGEDDERITKEITLDDRDGTAYLGIGFLEPRRGVVSGILYSAISSVKDPLVHYEPVLDGDFVMFIYDLLWWIVVINILVALFNMLPVSVLDGGRFFYLTILGITGKEKFAKKAFSFMTWFIIGLLVLMMVRWIFVFF